MGGAYWLAHRSIGGPGRSFSVPAIGSACVRWEVGRALGGLRRAAVPDAEAVDPTSKAAGALTELSMVASRHGTGARAAAKRRHRNVCYILKPQGRQAPQSPAPSAPNPGACPRGRPGRGEARDGGRLRRPAGGRARRSADARTLCGAPGVASAASWGRNRGILRADTGRCGGG